MVFSRLDEPFNLIALSFTNVFSHVRANHADTDRPGPRERLNLAEGTGLVYNAL